MKKVVLHGKKYTLDTEADAHLRNLAHLRHHYLQIAASKPANYAQEVAAYNTAYHLGNAIKSFLKLERWKRQA